VAAVAYGKWPLENGIWTCWETLWEMSLYWSKWLVPAGSVNTFDKVGRIATAPFRSKRHFGILTSIICTVQIEWRYAEQCSEGRRSRCLLGGRSPAGEPRHVLFIFRHTQQAGWSCGRLSTDLLLGSNPRLGTSFTKGF
jgi:hypothetical protein